MESASPSESYEFLQLTTTVRCVFGWSDCVLKDEKIKLHRTLLEEKYLRQCHFLVNIYVIYFRTGCVAAVSRSGMDHLFSGACHFLCVPSK